MPYNLYQISRINNLNAEGNSASQIANILQISRSGVSDFLKRKNQNENCKDKPKILFFDLETAPTIAATFDRYNATITPNHVIEEGGWLLSAAWKFEHETEISSFIATPEQAIARYDFDIVKSISEAYNKADIVVAQNGDKFDIKVLKTRVLLNGLPPLRKVKSIDTLKLAKKLKFNANSLDSLGKILGFGGKVKTGGIKLWLDCIKGDKKALSKMLKYNITDVKLLEKVYYKLLPYVDSGNIGVYYNDNDMHCPSCGSINLINVQETYSDCYGYKGYKCLDCGHYSSDRKSIKKDNNQLQLKSSV